MEKPVKNNTILSVQNLKKHYTHAGLFSEDKGTVFAVNDISFTVGKGETLGLVGESGCGKTTTGKVITRLLEPTAGKISFNGQEIQDLKAKELKKFRKDIQIIFQDPYSSLNPRKTVATIIGDALKIHHIGKRESRLNNVLELMNIVGLLPEHVNRFPHEFSGGQRQRIGIARALAVKPKFIVCDEPVSALDVSIQAQILNLLKNLQKQFDLTYLFIAHNFSVVKHISTRIAVMYLGKLVEIGESDALYTNPLHPYTQFLLSAIPEPDPKKTRSKKRVILEGDIPSPIDLPGGCYFHPRCPYAEDICKRTIPDLKSYPSKQEHFSACHFTDRFIP
jgi:oligopeptide transport system ATP-binding protein